MSDLGREIQGGPSVHEEHRLASWNEFREAIKRIEGKYGHHEKGDGKRYRNEVVYRGQRSAAWPLETTLERQGYRDISVLRYLELAIRYRNHLEVLSDTSWEIPDSKKVIEQLDEKKAALWFSPPAYPYLVYLRHHGFPSPLLDWSSSPYVAAFFAFQDAIPEDGADVAIYAFIETPKGLKRGALGARSITLLGPNVRTHKRHFL